MIALLLTQLILLGPAIGHVATQAPEVVEDLLSDIDRQREVRDLKKLPVARLSDVLRFTRNADMLTIVALPKPEDSLVQVIVPNVRGSMKLMIFLSPDADNGMRGFLFERAEPHHPMYGDSRSSWSSGTNTMVSRFFESSTIFGNVQLIQDPAPASGAMPSEQAPVRLLVKISDKRTDAALVNLQLQASTFTQLCREHRAEVDRYLRPIVRDFDQDQALFAVPPALAWQVLGDPAADPTLSAKVQQLLHAADTEDYRQRQSAVNALKALGAAAQPVLRSLERAKLSVQQASIVESLLAEPGVTASAPALADDPSFLLDVLYDDDPRLKTLALTRLRKATRQTIETAEVKDAAAVDQLRDRLLPVTLGVK